MSRAQTSTLNIALPIKALTPFHWDVRLMVLVLLLLATGLVVLTSASLGVSADDYGNSFFYLNRQLQALLVAGIGFAFMLAVPSDTWLKLSPLLLLFAIALLALVLITGVGTKVNCWQSWVSLAGNRVQVSEPARLALIFYIAGYAVRQQQALETTFLGLAKPIVVLTIAGGLLLAEPDLGAATVLMATAMILLFCAGARLRDFAVFVVLAVGAFLALALTSDYRLRRLTAFRDPWADPFNDSFQLTQSLIAIGRGEWFGVGLGNGVQKLFYLPEAHTDFVFAVFAEEFGLLGVGVLSILILMMILRILRIAKDAAQAERWFVAHAVLGIGVWLGLQSFINLGVNLGLLPTKGLTLPLVSYGRSSIIVVLAALGFVFRVHHENRCAALAPKPRKRRRK